MKIVFVSNFINHYQIPLSDDLYELTKGNFYFVETQALPASFRKSGFLVYDRPYIVRAWENVEEKSKSFQLVKDADVMIAGGGRFILPYERIRLRSNKLTLEYGERPLKRGLINAFSKTNVLTQLHYHLLFYNKPFYKLCASAYTANDMYVQRSFIGRCYKFGYFPAIPEQDVAAMLHRKEENRCIRMVWCARFISWKHPELVIKLAEKLRAAGYDFEISMIGSGELHEKMKQMIADCQLADYVHLLGNYSNAEVTQMMAEHDIFLFTSNRNEGWGVVLNEAMGQLCCPVASDMIGAVPFLMEDGRNGLIYKSGSVDSLFEKVRYLLDHPHQMREMACEAYQTVSTTWNPSVAAKRLHDFCDALLNHKDINYESGPLSLAVPIKK